MKIQWLGWLVVLAPSATGCFADEHNCEINPYACVSTGAGATSGAQGGGGAGGATANCADGKQNGDESDVDCGGSCLQNCKEDDVCNTDADCRTNFCSPNGTCKSATCNDGIKNGDETALDCGGGTCRPCGPGMWCEKDEDCLGQQCDGNRCTANCSDGVQNNDESDVDCGAGIDCKKCEVGQRCAAGEDCANGSCPGKDGVCCDAPCDGECLACVQAKTGVGDGQCAHVKANEDPDDECADGLSGECATTGVCNGMGACARFDCMRTNASASCHGDTCTIDSCNAEFGNCDGNPVNGCETETSSDEKHCGACNKVCVVLPNTQATFCKGGQCAVGPCKPGHDDCNKTVNDGCEADTRTDKLHCGSCDNNCDQQGGMKNKFECDGGSETQKHCGCSNDYECDPDGMGGESGTCEGNGRCTCGGITCKPAEACKLVSGASVCSCNGGRTCGPNRTCCQTPGGCKNLTSDVTNCGACGRVCPPEFDCAASMCICNDDSDCNAGSPGTCTSSFKCKCGSTTCTEGQRCQPDGTCG